MFSSTLELGFQGLHGSPRTPLHGKRNPILFPIFCGDLPMANLTTLVGTNIYLVGQIKCIAFLFTWSVG